MRCLSMTGQDYAQQGIRIIIAAALVIIIGGMGPSLPLKPFQRCTKEKAEHENIMDSF